MRKRGEPGWLVIALCAVGGFALAMGVSYSGWDWSNTVWRVVSVLAFTAAGQLRRPRAKLINKSKETDS